MKTASMTCRKCGGSGEIPLTEELAQVLALVKRARGVSAVEVAMVLDPRNEFHQSAFNNRLEDLRASGYVKRRRAGRVWIYSAV